MNRSKLKTYAPQARRDFIRAMTDRAAYYGLTPGKTEPASIKGDVAIIGGKAFPASVVEKRQRLEERIERHGFEQTMEAMAYTWFNRLVAIRYMELHEYLDHGYRVLSHRGGGEGKLTPEIVEHAEHVDLPGLDKNKVIELKLDGTKESELYRRLLIAQCHALHAAMPFLFERIADETELLLPDNLLNSDSIIRKLVNEIEEADWQEVEIIGWLYQFYISEKKDEVIGSVVKSEDIPAATQLFTPNWIVKYLVQNSLGRQWLATYPQSPLKAKMEFYIEPAEQTSEVQAQLKMITPENLNPEELTLMDPACGSGHILVEAYDLLKEIYLERGYRLRDIPKLILTKNLFGMEIDDRAAQLAAFALMMKARADDRRIFDMGGDQPRPQPNVLAIQESNGLNVNAIVQAFTDKKITSTDISTVEIGLRGAVRAPLFLTENQSTVDDRLVADLKSVIALFDNAKTFGSLIVVPEPFIERLHPLHQLIQETSRAPALESEHVIRTMGALIHQASLLARRYSVVAANPPFLNRKMMSPPLKDFGDVYYASTAIDAFAMFYERSWGMLAQTGIMALVTPFLWMFNATYKGMRSHVLHNSSILSLIQFEYNGFEPACVPVALFCCSRFHSQSLIGDYIKLSDFRGPDNQRVKTLEAIKVPTCGWRYKACAEDFTSIPDQPIAYWASNQIRSIFHDSPKLESLAQPRQGTATADNNRFLRLWYEVSWPSIGWGVESLEAAKASGCRWFPHSKGGDFRRWYGNNDYVIDWEDDGRAVRQFGTESGGRPKSRVQNTEYFFRSGITWSDLTSSYFAARFVPVGFTFNVTGPTLFPERECDTFMLLGYVNSRVFQAFLDLCLQGMHYNNGVLAQLPCRTVQFSKEAETTVRRLVEISKADWDRREVSWEFASHSLIAFRKAAATIEASADALCQHSAAQLQEHAALEQTNNRFFINAYGLQHELTTDIADDEATLKCPDIKGEIISLLSFVLGCAMGRYSLDKPGLIYAKGGNEGFDASQYKTFPADRDGIVPVTEIDWFADDAAHRFEEFVGAAWPEDHLEENLDFVADSIGPKGGEQPRDTIRRYFADAFYKHHLQTYKRRPIYWLFTSGKLGAFQCLVYLHRYHEGTLSRMRTEYVIPLQGKIAARIETLEGDKAQATSTSHRKSIEKKQDTLRKQQQELLAFDEKLRHYADLRIKLDLDDGVKANYRKFADPAIGEIVAEVKAICGKDEEE